MSHWSRVGVVLALAALASVVPWPVAAIDAPTAERELLALTNLSRTSNGLSALARDPRLTSVAGSRSEDMITRGYFSHAIPPDGRTVIDILESLGVRGVAAENIEFNNAVDFTTVQFASNDFMNSPGHRVNVLNPRWNRVGAGVAEGSSRKMYTVLFLQDPQQAAPATVGAPPLVAPAVPSVGRGERADVVMAPTRLVDGLVNRLLRLALNL